MSQWFLVRPAQRAHCTSLNSDLLSLRLPSLSPSFVFLLRYLDFFADFISFFLLLFSPKKYTPSDPAFAYAQLTHDELIQLVLKQKETISKKEFQVRELEDYIDNLLVRVMEETPNILRVPAQVGKKAGKMWKAGAQHWDFAVRLFPPPPEVKDSVCLITSTQAPSPHLPCMSSGKSQSYCQEPS